ncbi:hypothetical protein ACOME3_009035 [Neoechinorhynchus agilis]
MKNTTDDAAVRSMFEHLGMNGVKPHSILRLPGKRTDIPRWLLVCLSEGEVIQALKISRHLRNVSGFENVFIDPDRSPAEETLSKIGEIRSANPDKRYVIRNDRIVQIRSPKSTQPKANQLTKDDTDMGRIAEDPIDLEPPTTWNRNRTWSEIRRQTCLPFGISGCSDHRADRYTRDELSSALAFRDGSKSIIVAGDFNVNILKSDKDRTVEFLQFMNEIGLLLRSSNFQHAYSHPRGSSVIDLIFSNTDRVNGSVLSESQWSLVRGPNPVQFDWSQETCSRGKTVMPRLQRSRILVVEKLHRNFSETAAIALKDVGPDFSYRFVSSELIKTTRERSTVLSPMCLVHLDATLRNLRALVLVAHRARHIHPVWESVYTALRRDYRARLKITLNIHLKNAELSRIAAAERFPWKLNPYRRRSPGSSTIPMATWMSHFENLLGRPGNHYTSPRRALHPYETYNGVHRTPSMDQLAHLLARQPNHKANGFDELSFERLKSSFSLMGRPPQAKTPMPPPPTTAMPPPTTAPIPPPTTQMPLPPTTPVPPQPMTPIPLPPATQMPPQPTTLMSPPPTTPM